MLIKHCGVDEGEEILMKSRGPTDGYGLTSEMFTVKFLSPPATLCTEPNSTRAVAGP